MFQRRTFWLLAATALLVGGLAAGGCNQQKPQLTSPEDNTDAGGSADTGMIQTDTGPQGPDTVTVRVSLDPALAVYRSAVRVTTKAEITAPSGEAVTDADVAWSVEPKGAAQKAGSRWKFVQEGEVTFVACANKQSWNQEFCGRKTVLVDESPPNIRIDSPEAGAQLGAGNKKKVTVSGKVTDSGTDKNHAFVNGTRVSLESDGSFETTIAPVFGVNHVTVAATDGRNNSNSSAEREFLWAKKWKKVQSEKGTVSYDFGDGIALDLGQNFFDDDQPPQPKPMEKKLVTNDFADLIQLVIRTIDLTEEIPSQIDTGTGVVQLVNINLASPTVEIDITDDGIAVYLTIGGIDIATGGKLRIDRQNLDVSGNITARAAAVAKLSLQKPGPDKPFKAMLENVDISIDELDSQFASDQANAIFDLAESTLRSKLEDILAETLRKEFVDTLPKMLTDTLNSLESSLASQSFEFESKFTGKRKISFEGAIETFETKFRDSLLAVLSTELSATGMDLFAMAPGIPMMTPVAKELPLFQQSRVQIGLRLGVLNGLLTTLWKAGFLEIDATNVLPDSASGLVKKAQLSGRMPPVMRPAQGSEPYDLVLEAGQLELTTKAALRDQTDKYGINIRAGVNVTISDNKLTLEIPDKPALDTWLIETTGDSPVLQPDGLKQLIIDNVWPELEKSIKDGLQLDLPVPEVSGLSNLSKSLKKLKLSFELARPVVTRRGYVVFDTELKGELPLGGSP